MEGTSTWYLFGYWCLCHAKECFALRKEMWNGSPHTAPVHLDTHLNERLVAEVGEAVHESQLLVS